MQFTRKIILFLDKPFMGRIQHDPFLDNFYEVIRLQKIFFCSDFEASEKRNYFLE